MTTKLAIKERSTIGKANERLAGTGNIPAVFYGPKEQSTSIEVSARDFDKVLKEAGESTVVVLSGIGADKDALIKSVDFDPVSGVPRHADFYVLEKGKKVEVNVPIEFTGEAPAVKQGANLVKVLHEIEVEAMPANLPHEIIVDVSGLTSIDQQILVKDIVPPAGVEIKTSGDEVVVLIAAAHEEKEEAAPVDLSAIEVEKKGKEDVPEEAAAE